MAKTLYTAKAHVSGGREEGHGKTDDGKLEVDLRPPGTEGDATNPEQLFAVGYGACFEGAVRAVARRQKVELTDVSVDAEVDLMTTEDRGFGIGVRLAVQLAGIDDETAVSIVRTAHDVCPYSNATRGNVEVGLTANGQAVS